MALTGPSRDLTAFPVSFWVALGFLVIFCTFAAYLGWLWAVAKIGAGRTAVTTYIIPLFSLAYARIWLGEPIGIPTVIGAICILIGVVFANAGGRLDGKSGGVSTVRPVSD
jgi:drug/metabolite transporter (DMT)-like permease